MLACFKCGKSRNKVAYSRHKKGSSGAGGTWALRAPIHQRFQRPNLHIYKGNKYCTKCLRIVKKAFQAQVVNKSTAESVQTAQPASA